MCNKRFESLKSLKIILNTYFSFKLRANLAWKFVPSGARPKGHVKLYLWRQVVWLSSRTWRKRRGKYGKVDVIVWLGRPTIEAARIPATHQISRCTSFLWIQQWEPNGWNSCSGTELISANLLPNMPRCVRLILSKVVTKAAWHFRWTVCRR